MTRRLAVTLAAVLLAFVPDIAHAHAPIPGIGDFYSGMLHPWIVPPHILAIVGLGLLTGQRGPRYIELSLLTFAASIALGLVGAGYGIAGPPETALLALAAVEGITVAAFPRLPRPFCGVLAFTTGILVGFDSAPETPTLRATLMALGGTGIGASLALVYSAGLADYVKQPWQQIGVRVLGSWIAASSILVLALAMAGRLPSR